MVNDYQKSSALKTPGHTPQKEKAIKDKTFNRLGITAIQELFTFLWSSLLSQILRNPVKLFIWATAR
jgi:hypothetical protein